MRARLWLFPNSTDYAETPMKVLRSLALAALSSAAGAAHAVDYSFTCIAGVAGACADGASNLTMSVSAGASGSVDFTFRNFSALGSSITEVYFDDGTLLGLAGLADSGNGVTFSQIGSGSPGDLPAGNSITPAFQVTAGFLVDTGNGGPSKGVENLLDGGTQEFVTINFSLINGKTFADTLVALNGPLGDGNDLRVGLHVKAFNVVGNDSASFVSAVPEPASIAMLLSGFAVLGLVSLRKRRFD